MYVWTVTVQIYAVKILRFVHFGHFGILPQSSYLGVTRNPALSPTEFIRK